VRNRSRAAVSGQKTGYIETAEGPWGGGRLERESMSGTRKGKEKSGAFSAVRYVLSTKNKTLIGKR